MPPRHREKVISASANNRHKDLSVEQDAANYKDNYKDRDAGARSKRT